MHELLGQETLTIGITTFRRRLPLLDSLLHSVRRWVPEAPIIVTVNADYGSLLDEEYRSQVLTLCSRVRGVYPLVFPHCTGLAKMWNSVIVNSPSSHCLILNDDLEVESPAFYEEALGIIQGGKGHLDPVRDLLLLNGSWSHFCIGKKLAHQLGYFDERLLSFGEEDGDFYWRFEEVFGARPTTLDVPGIRNTQEGYRIPAPGLKVEDRGSVLRPRFNRLYIEAKYSAAPAGIRGMFGSPRTRSREDLLQYPYESFKWKNFPILGTDGSPDFEEDDLGGNFRSRFVVRDLGRSTRGFFGRLRSHLLLICNKIIGRR